MNGTLPHQVLVEEYLRWLAINCCMFWRLLLLQSVQVLAFSGRPLNLVIRESHGILWPDNQIEGWDAFFWSTFCGLHFFPNLILSYPIIYVIFFWRDILSNVNPYHSSQRDILLMTNSVLQSSHVTSFLALQSSDVRSFILYGLLPVHSFFVQIFLVTVFWRDILSYVRVCKYNILFSVLSSDVAYFLCHMTWMSKSFSRYTLLPKQCDIFPNITSFEYQTLFDVTFF